MVAAGIPGTPLTVSGHVGRSSGSADTRARARLRPGGRYWDHGVALEYRKDRWSAALRYADTSLGKGVAHSGGYVDPECGRDVLVTVAEDEWRVPHFRVRIGVCAAEPANDQPS
jgi:hypothetical protein